MLVAWPEANLSPESVASPPPPRRPPLAAPAMPPAMALFFGGVSRTQRGQAALSRSHSEAEADSGPLSPFLAWIGGRRPTGLPGTSDLRCRSSCIPMAVT